MRKKELILTRLRLSEGYTVDQNLDYASQACRDSLSRGMNPFSPMTSYSSFMFLNIKSSRRLYLLLSSEWVPAIPRIAIYIRPDEKVDGEVKEILELIEQRNKSLPVTQVYTMSLSGDIHNVEDWNKKSGPNGT